MSQFTEKDWDRLWNIFHQIKENPDPEFLKHLEKQEPDFFLELKQLLAASEESAEVLENLVVAEIQTLSEEDIFEPQKIEPGELLAGRFRIVRELGTGGMGTVYEAIDEELGGSVALKIMRSDLAADDSARERFHREINLARRITHPNACRIFELFHHEEMLFLTMELLQGETLRQRIRRDGPLKTADALPIALQISQALSAIHSCGIIHRDLKTSNIILIPEGSRAVVTDFGLAIPLPEKFSSQMTATGQVLGTPEFMAPEQLTRGKITPATDIYALGLVLYEMVTGGLPINEESSLTIAAKRISEDAPSPRIKAPDLKRNWEKVILRCLERNPKYRFQTAKEVASALQDKSIGAWNPFFSHRNRVVLPIAVSILVIGTVLGFLFYKKNTFFPSNSRANDIVVRRLWKGATGLPGGLVSTDGTTLIDVDWLTADLIAIDFASGKKKRITQSKNFFLPENYTEFPLFTSISHDGSQIAYSVKHPGVVGCDLRILTVKDQSVRTIYSNNNNCLNPFDWSAAGDEMLALHSLKNGTAEIVLVSLKSSFLKSLKSVSSSDVRKMSLSPDGRYVIYDFEQGDRSPNRDVFLLSVKDNQEKLLIQHKANDYVLGWSPDGNQVVFASDRSGTYDAWSIPVRDGEPQGDADLLRKDIGQIYPLRISSDGSFYYAHMITSRDLFTTELKGGSRTTKFSYGVVGSNRAPDFSPDGKFLYFQTTSDPISSRWDFDPPALIKSISLESSEEKAVTNSEFMPMGLMTRLSPNGKMLLTTGTGTDGSGLYRIDLETDQSSQIVRNLENNFVRPFEWSSDEARVFCLFNTGGEIIQKEIATGIEKKIFDGVSNFAVSRDAKSMVVTKSDIKKGDTSLILVNLENGQSRQLLQVKMPEFIPVYTWTPDGKYLLFAKSRRDLIDEPHEIWKISIPEGRVEDLHIKSEYVTDIRVHPDNHRIIIAGQVDSSEIWVMENFL